MTAFQVRVAEPADIPLLAVHRTGMFRDMGQLPAEREATLLSATTEWLRSALPRGEYLAWVAEARGPSREIVGGAGVQLRPIMPRPYDDGSGFELGPEAMVLNVYVEPDWRRRGVADAMMRVILASLAERGIRRIVLHASPMGRALYERLGFAVTNEMRLMAKSP